MILGCRRHTTNYAENGTKNWLKMLTKEQVENESQLLVMFTVILHQLSHGMRTSQMYQYPWVCRQWCSLSRILWNAARSLLALSKLLMSGWLSDGHLQPTQKLVHRYSNPSNLLTSRANWESQYAIASQSPLARMSGGHCLNSQRRFVTFKHPKFKCVHWPLVASLSTLCTTQQAESFLDHFAEVCWDSLLLLECFLSFSLSDCGVVKHLWPMLKPELRTALHCS